MSDGSKESFGGELAKQLPVKELYADLAHPALSTVGQALQGTTRIALAPITALVWGYDKIAEYLDVAIPEYFAKRKIKKENIATPDPTIAVPLIEAMRYTSHKPELREMFVNLLGASMNSEVYDEHPAFVEIIKQLCTDECKMLAILHDDPKMPMLKLRLKVDSGGATDISPYFSDICYKANCEHPQKFPEYLDNLHRLGLVEIHYDSYLVEDSYYEELRKHPDFSQYMPQKCEFLFEKKSMYLLSEMGKKFCKLCMD
ncbi:MAG: DUF4393 domain-containing protein [Clostridiales bacterium]|nr:DUF4393 domain-containing protein [Clostridiales bacterium]